MKRRYKTADEAFRHLYDDINNDGIDFSNTKTLFNVGFLIEEPWNNKIKTKFRKWSVKYAEAEWLWYLTGDPKVEKLGEIYGIVPKIWNKMADENGEVNSNYGAQWERGYQLDKVVAKLKSDPNTRQAVYLYMMVKKYQDIVTILHVQLQYSFQLSIISWRCALRCDLTTSGSVSALINIVFHNYIK